MSMRFIVTCGEESFGVRGREIWFWAIQNNVSPLAIAIGSMVSVAVGGVMCVSVKKLRAQHQK